MEPPLRTLQKTQQQRRFPRRAGSENNKLPSIFPLNRLPRPRNRVGNPSHSVATAKQRRNPRWKQRPNLELVIWASSECLLRLERLPNASGGFLEWNNRRKRNYQKLQPSPLNHYSSVSPFPGALRSYRIHADCILRHSSDFEAQHHEISNEFRRTARADIDPTPSEQHKPSSGTA